MGLWNEIELRSSEASRSERFAVGNNLYSILRSLRHRSNTRAFWIDAICIDQNDAHDKTRHIGLMRDIYHSAQNVCVWLGDNRISRAGLAFIPRMLDFNGVELTRDLEAVEEWTSFSILLKSSVFPHRWLLQEVLVAQNVTLHCGKCSIHYADFVDAVALFKTHQDEILKLFRRHHKSSRDLVDLSVTRTEKPIDITSNALQWSRKDNSLQRHFSLETLVSLLGDFDTADPRDTVFALLGLAKDGPELFRQMPLGFHRSYWPSSYTDGWDKRGLGSLSRIRHPCLKQLAVIGYFLPPLGEPNLGEVTVVDPNNTIASLG